MTVRAITATPRIIADEETARRIGRERIAELMPAEFTVFSYEQKFSRLMLFGVEITSTDANGNRQTETILYQ